MIEKGYRQFRIDPEFKALIRPLTKEEYSTLEANLILDGCREPIVTWNGLIVDGHNRYEICNRLHIPYHVVAYDFDSREDAIIWICNNQLGRRNITEETRKYLVGKQYDAEKAANCQRNSLGDNQYQRKSVNRKPTEINTPSNDRVHESGRRTANRLGEMYHLSAGAVIKYSKYSRALDELGKKVPELVPHILNGSFKISHENLIALAEKTAEEIRQTIGKGIGTSTPQYRRYAETRQSMQSESEQKKPEPSKELPGIKQMPKPDPDSEVTGLVFTIPNWKSSIERMKVISDLNTVSASVKNQLREALLDLKDEVEKTLKAIEEDV